MVGEGLDNSRQIQILESCELKLKLAHYIIIRQHLSKCLGKDKQPSSCDEAIMSESWRSGPNQFSATRL